MTLRVMTWNVWWHFGQWHQRFPRIVETVRSVDPDVLCVQEAWANRTRTDAERLAIELGYHVVETDPIFFRNEAFSNAILSRWPLEPIATEPLPDAEGSPSHRRLIAAAVDTPWGRWPVASTHLEHRFDRSADRRAQLRRLMELGRHWRGDPEHDLPLIVGADLNAVPDADEVRMVTGREPGVAGIVFSDAWEQVGIGPGHTWLGDNPHSTDSAWPNRRLDYLLVSWPRPKPVGNPVRAWRVADGPVDGLWPSDHCALVAEFVVPADASTGASPG
jgi:endonuclease/exonuclease/phosphatase family metal-dependent hydrolase